MTFSDLPPDLDEFPPLDEDAQSALDELFNRPTGVEAGFLADVETWSIAERTDSELVLFGQPAAGSEGYVSASFDERGGEWRPTSWGGCEIFIEAPGLGPATVGFDPAAPPLPADTTLELLINERACASGQPPTDREVVVRATEDADTVTIVALVAPVEGGAECPDNPWFPVEVELDEPHGDRQLLDGVQFPPAPVGPADE